MGPPGAVASHYLQMLPPLVSVVRRFFWTKILPTKEWKLPIFQLSNIWESGTLQPGIFHKIWLKFLQKKSPTKQTKQNKAEQSKAKLNKAKQTNKTNKQKALEDKSFSAEILGAIFWGVDEEFHRINLSDAGRPQHGPPPVAMPLYKPQVKEERKWINDGWWIMCIKPQVV